MSSTGQSLSLLSGQQSGVQARQAILRSCLASRASSAVELDAFAVRLEGYSGSDVVQLAREAAMRPLRRLLTAIEAAGASPRSQRASAGVTVSNALDSSAHCGADPHGGGAGRASSCALGSSTPVVPSPVDEADLEAALQSVRPTAHAHASEFAAFDKHLGSQAESRGS